MLYFPQARLAYVAVPKTGGTATEKALEHLSEVKHDFSVRAMHLPASWIKQKYGSDVEVVGLIREPVSWLASKYRYLSGEHIGFGDKYSTRLIGFDGFLKRVLRGEKAWSEPLFEQCQYLDSADTIFQYEQFDLFVDYMRSRLGVTFMVERHNVSPVVDISPSSAMVSAIKQRFRRDVDLHEASHRPK